MLSLIWTVFFVHVAIYLINTIGASTIDGVVRRARPVLLLASPTRWAVSRDYRANKSSYGFCI